MSQRFVRILRLTAVLDRIGVSKSTLDRLISRGQFPPPIRLAPRCIGWDEAQVDAWLVAKVGAPR
ncbi:MAG: AlpA family phage regulatory protein [Acidobacteria bacterium]|nr:AlpA family phage regulatory protein [Acidobacteriota bacterium]